MPTYSKNKKAYHDFEILDSFEAGIVLNGDEVKSIKASQVQLVGAYVDIENTEAFLHAAHVSRYKFSHLETHDPTRKRKLILHKKEIEKIATALDTKGITAIPLELYSKKGLIKIKIGLCRGKKLHDKRDTLKKRDQEREIRKEIKKFQN